jgi:hypothetical protein
MFPETEDEPVWQTRIDAIEDVKNNKPPKTSFDFLFIIENPRFEKFYHQLRKE